MIIVTILFAATLTASAPAGITGASGPVLELEEALQRALRAQPLLAQSRATIRVNEARLGEAEAPGLPQLELDAQASLGSSNPQQIPGANGTPEFVDKLQPYPSLSAQFVGRQLIYDFGRVAGQIRLQAATTRAAQFDEKATRDECMLFSNAADPQAECASTVEKYRTCMRGFGFHIA